MNYKFFLFFIVGVSGTAFGATVLPGDVSNGTQSFDFSVNNFSYNSQVGSLFVGATTGTPGDFAVSCLFKASNSFVGITPQTVSLDNVANQENPLYNTNIAQMALVGASPVVTTTTDQTSLYVIQSFGNQSNVSVLSATQVNDANGLVTSGIVALGSDTIAPLTATSQPSKILAFVAPNGGTFGAAGSGIAAAVLHKASNAAQVQYELTLENTITGTAGNLAYPVNITTPSLIITSTLASLSDPVLYFDQYTTLFFAGFQAVAGSGGSAGARGVLRITQYPQIAINEIAPTTAIGPDSIIGTSTPSGFVTIYDVKTMFTSTNLEYLVVRGGTSTSGTLSRQIYALPMVDVAGNSYGALAAKNSLPVNVFASAAPSIFQGRTYVVPATTPDQLFTSTELPARVGGAELPEDAHSMIIKNDAVIVATQGLSEGCVYISQAIFDTYGRIAFWTPWTRSAGTVSNVFGIAIENDTGDFLYSTGEDTSSINTVVRTGWANTGNIATALAQFFTQDTAGIQGFFNYTNTAVADGGSGTDASCCIATGYNQLSLVQTGSVVSAQLAPLPAIGTPFISTNGTLTEFAPGAHQIAVSGGDLASLGAMIATAFVQNGPQAWLFVGGIGGLAVLANDDGSGFDSTTGIGNGLSNLSPTMRFRKVGTYTNIRKLVPGTGTIQDLYVLTSSAFERASISQASVAVGGTWNSTLLAQAPNIVGKYGSFSDCLISPPLALIATSAGLIRSGNGMDISTATEPREVEWTPVNMPESPGPVTRLFPISPTAQLGGFAQGGNVYALAAAVSTSQARVYRYVTNLVDNVVTDSTVQLFPDYFVAQPANPTQGRQSFLMSVGNYRNYFYMNGANYYFMRSAYLEASPFVTIMTQPILTGVSGLGIKQSPVLIPREYRAMGQLVPLSSTGGLCAYGDFGLQVNE